MAITSVSEFEAIVTRVRLRIEKELVVRPNHSTLEAARRVFERAGTLARTPDKLKAFRDELDAAGETLRAEITPDEQLADLTWDVIDFIDYRS